MTTFSAERACPYSQIFRLPVAARYEAAHSLLARRPVLAARMHEGALMIDLRQHFYVRSTVLAGINLSKGLIRDADGRIATLHICERGMKNGPAIDAPIPPELERNIQAHLIAYRPHLPGSHSDWLFPSPGGGPRSLFSVQQTLARAIREECIRAEQSSSQ